MYGIPIASVREAGGQESAGASKGNG